MPSQPLRLGILGSTGSIGTQTLDVVRENPERFRVEYLSAARSAGLLLEQVAEFQPKYISLADEAQAGALSAREALPKLYSGPDAASFLVRTVDVDMVVVGITGFAALQPVLAAIEANTHIALANKEVLVAASSLIRDAMAESTACIVPVDSEHSSIFQCLMGRGKKDLRRIILTASGGPFLHTPAERLEKVSPNEASAHPNWDMGRKISIDSATLMNKGLEVIEAAALFELEADKIEVLIHPQSVIHGLVEYKEGASLAALYHPDMRIPIAFALDYIGAVVQNAVYTSRSGAEYLDLTQVSRLEFFAPDLSRFPCLALAYKALREGGLQPTRLNAANEVAVDAFCSGAIGFLDIARVTEEVLAGSQTQDVVTIEEISKSDALARRAASEVVSRISELTETENRLS